MLEYCLLLPAKPKWASQWKSELKKIAVLKKSTFSKLLVSLMMWTKVKAEVVQTKYPQRFKLLIRQLIPSRKWKFEDSGLDVGYRWRRSQVSLQRLCTPKPCYETLETCFGSAQALYASDSPDSGSLEQQAEGRVAGEFAVRYCCHLYQ